ncbi:MAG: helix-turn-helix transcriptional regulator [Pseudomonadota bacterium]
MLNSTIANETPDFDTLGGRLLRARVAANLSVNDIAKQIGVKKQTLEAWETDRSEPRSNKLTTLSGLLGVSPTWLLYGVGSSPQTETVSDEIQVLKGSWTVSTNYTNRPAWRLRISTVLWTGLWFPITSDVGSRKRRVDEVEIAARSPGHSCRHRSCFGDWGCTSDRWNQAATA